MSLSLAAVLLLVLAAEFVNGLTDAPNAIATVVSTRVLSPSKAVFMAAVMNILGVLVTGTAVAFTVGKGIVEPEAIGLHTVAAAMIAIVVWATVAWWFGLPTSETHALVAGLAGAGLAAAGPAVLLWEGWRKVLIGLGLSTVVGFLFGFVAMSAIYRLFRRASPTFIKGAFGRLQILSAAFMAFSHGSNDGQKFIGVFALALLLAGLLPEFYVPIWVILLCGVVMGLGTAFGGWRIIRTMGVKLTHLEPVNGFAAESSASAAILLASSLGIPLSTTQAISTAIMGVGATRRFSAVRWGVTQEIVLAWLLTFPACGVLGFVFAWIMRYVL
ncbi:MAG TPA: inorganic phosphate transporter [Dehalococcoidia bacterium]|nr:inorganic phosphate transporter [Dehalococcoidia bacterium]